MANTPVKIVGAAVPTTDTVMYTAANKTIITEVWFTNTTDADILLNMRINALDWWDDILVPANGFIQTGTKQVLNATDVLGILAGGAGLNAFISGVEITP